MPAGVCLLAWCEGVETGMFFSETTVQSLSATGNPNSPLTRPTAAAAFRHRGRWHAAVMVPGPGWACPGQTHPLFSLFSVFGAGEWLGIARRMGPPIKVLGVGFAEAPRTGARCGCAHGDYIASVGGRSLQEGFGIQWDSPRPAHRVARPRWDHLHVSPVHGVAAHPSPSWLW